MMKNLSKHIAAALVALATLPAWAAGSSGIVDKQFIQAATSATARTFTDKASEVFSVKDFGAKGDGVTDDATAFTAAQTAAVAKGVAVTVPDGNYILSSDIASGGKWIISPGATISVRNYAAAPGSGGGYIAFNKSRITDDTLYQKEQIDTLQYGYGRNLLRNPYFNIWQRLDMMGGTQVQYTAPTYNVASTYSGSGGLRVYGPDGWFGKVWGGAYNSADATNYAGAGTGTLERKRYGTTGDIDSDYYLRWTFTGYNSKAGQYTDPVYGLLDYGTNSTEISQVIPNARRTGKFTSKFRLRYTSGDATVALRLTYSFGTGGSPSPNVIVNAQSFTLDTTPGNTKDYVVHFEVPELTVDGSGNPITFGTNNDSYITLTLSSGDNGNFVYDVFAMGLWHGWGFTDWEKIPKALDLVRCREDFRYVKAGLHTPTTNGNNYGGIATLQPQMLQTPDIKWAKLIYNSGAFNLASDPAVTYADENGFLWNVPATFTGNNSRLVGFFELDAQRVKK